MTVARGLPPTTTPEDCTQCGACCFSEMPTYLQIFRADEQRLTAQDQHLVVRSNGRATLRMNDGRCAALRADPRSRRLLCSIYSRRPDVCRSLKRGSGECLQHRAEKLDRAAAWFETLRKTLAPG